MRPLLQPFPAAVMLAVAAVLGILTYGVTSSGHSETIDDALAEGRSVPAPALTLPRLEGDAPASLSDYRGRVVVLNFWASWCVPCREESPLLQRWHERIRSRGGTVLGVNVLDVSSDARSFAAKYGLRYPLLRDGDGRTLKDFEVAGQPWTFVIGRDGRITAVRRGPVDERFMREEVLPLTQQAS